MRYIAIFSFLIAIFSTTSIKAEESTPCPKDAICSHGLSIFGTPDYPVNFPHFAYVNPQAPKDGDIKLSSIGSFDSLNSFILKGVPADGISSIYDSLLHQSKDEPFAAYGLLAQRVILAKDRSWVQFELRPEAHWHDKTPITAHDVVFTFNVLRTKGHPFYRTYYNDVSSVEAINNQTVKFSFSTNTNRELPLVLGQMKILSKAWYTSHDFTKTSLTPQMGSGPYKIDALDAGKWIRYTRVDDYWAKDLPVNKGQYNFNSITYDYYRDGNVAFEAFKAGEFDFRMENISKNWATGYNFPALKDGRIVKEEIYHQIPTGMQGFVMNSRLSKFSNPNVRKALGYAFDFEWTNKQLFYNAYTRTESYFSNSDYAHTRQIGEGERALLKPFRNQLPAEVFTTKYNAPKTSGSGNDRTNLRIAKKLLQEAGWKITNGELIHSESGEKMTFEFLLASPSFERVVGPFIMNLKKLGINATMRTVDSAQYIKRTEEFDFDIIVSSFGQSNSPGNEQKNYWHSSTANQKGSRNLAGISHPAIDSLVDAVTNAKTRKDLTTATRALDRVLCYGYYVIPNWHVRSFRISYNSQLKHPELLPKYDLGFMGWWIDKANNTPENK